MAKKKTAKNPKVAVSDLAATKGARTRGGLNGSIPTQLGNVLGKGPVPTAPANLNGSIPTELGQ